MKGGRRGKGKGNSRGRSENGYTSLPSSSLPSTHIPFLFLCYLFRSFHITSADFSTRDILLRRPFHFHLRCLERVKEQGRWRKERSEQKTGEREEEDEE
jgi:hypothetical protein